MCWALTVGGGIPLTALVTWIFTAGILRADYDTVRAAALRAGEVNTAQELRLQRLELNYEFLCKSSEEIKGTVKDIKGILERRP